MYHVGIVVPRLEDGQARLTELLGLAWGPVIEAENPYVDAEGQEIIANMRICFSTEAPRFELIEEVPGTPWVCNEFSNIHHIGFYAENVVAMSGSLATARCPFEIGRLPEESDPTGLGWSYHRDQLGLRFELVAETMRPGLEEFAFKPAS
jgi:hypothetical protein